MAKFNKNESKSLNIFLPKINMLYRRHKNNDSLFFNPQYITESMLQTELMSWVLLAEEMRNYLVLERVGKEKEKGLKKRIVVWFSCGAASACAAKFAIEKYGRDRVSVVYCNTFSEEHQDNQRFMGDIEKWLGITVTVIGSNKYRSPTEVFEKTRYMSGPQGARCTVELKKVPRFEFQRADDIHIFGFTADQKECDRIKRFEANNHELNLDWVLLDAGITKARCYQILMDAGIKLPEMYLLGYKNNNCIGCVKASSPGYWNKVRVDFPEIFNSRAKQSRYLGCRLVIFKGKRIFLDELTKDVGKFRNENISCGPECVGKNDSKT